MRFFVAAAATEVTAIVTMVANVWRSGVAVQ
jgi:hypothetical protein